MALRGQLDDEIPRRTLDETLLIATWNLREFGAGKCGGRLDEAILYVAEIIARFDLVALQEYQPTNQLWRTPGICGFKSGWARFMLATVHIVGRQQAGATTTASPRPAPAQQEILGRDLDRRGSTTVTACRTPSRSETREIPRAPAPSGPLRDMGLRFRSRSSA